DMAALAAILQPVIDDVLDGDDDTLGTADDVDKVILTSHLQQFSLEQELIGLLSGVDIVLAGGSDTLLADGNDELDGETAAGDYPFVTTNLDGDTAVIVSTDGEYSYVGRLVVEFDADGVIIPASIDANVSGAFATTNAGVAALYNEGGALSDAEALDAAFAAGTTADTVRKLVDAVSDVVVTQDGNIVGQSDVFLNGARSDVRTQETNLGNITGDANLFVAQGFDDTVLVSIKNGGGIRDIIGFVGETEPGSGVVVETATIANPDAGKEAGDISQLDIANSLRFNNNLTLQTLTPEQLLEVLEHGVAATDPVAQTQPGQFAQVAGLSFSYDPTATARTADPDTGEQITAGERVQNVVIETADGPVAVVIDGQIADTAPDAIRIVTLNFIAGGGDNYPFEFFATQDPDFADVVQLADELTETGDFDFAAPGSEQDALAEFFSAFFNTDNGGAPFDIEDTPSELDERIQDVTVRTDTVLDGVVNPETPPTVAAPIADQFIAEDNAFELDVTASFAPDTPGETLALTTSELPDFLEFTNGVFTGTPTNDDVTLDAPPI
ncbi:MAG: 5'-nucleotidase C-terminal domain-containing protein, partial [Actinomycetota bacterium]